MVWILNHSMFCTSKTAAARKKKKKKMKTNRNPHEIIRFHSIVFGSSFLDECLPLTSVWACYGNVQKLVGVFNSAKNVLNNCMAITHKSLISTPSSKWTSMLYSCLVSLIPFISHVLFTTNLELPEHSMPLPVIWKWAWNSLKVKCYFIHFSVLMQSLKMNFFFFSFFSLSQSQYQLFASH